MILSPRDRALSIGDHEVIQSWESFERSLLTGIAVTIHPDAFLHYSDPSIDPQQDFDETLRHVRHIYKSELTRAFQHPSFEVGSAPYIPPSAYQQGGAVTAAYETVWVTLSNPDALQLYRDVAIGLISQAVVSGYLLLREWFTAFNVPEDRRRYPSHFPITVLAVCERHARKHHKNLRPREAQIISEQPLSPDQPLQGNTFTVTVPCRSGSLIYVVTDQMERRSLTRVTSKGARDLSSGPWPD